MRYSLHPEAAEDLRTAAAYYQERAGRVLAQALLDEFDRSVAMLLEHPGLGTLWRYGKRRYAMKRFPYSLIYMISDDEIRVLAIAHQSRRPGYWRQRQ